MEKKRVYLDSAEMRDRLRKYTPRPVAAITRTPQKISEINKLNNKIEISNIPIIQANISLPKSSKDTNSTNRPHLESNQQPSSDIQQSANIEKLVNISPNNLQSIDYNQTYKENNTQHIRTSFIKKLVKSLKQNKLAYGLSIAAFGLLVFGVGVNISGLMTNHKVEQQVAKAATQNGSNSSDSAATGPTGLDETPIDENTIKKYMVAPDMPRYLNISKIGVHSRVKRVATDKDGAVDTTKSVWDVGWYDASSKPGENGAAFIVGHVSGLNNHGIFYNLKKLAGGDIIQIEKGNGELINYKVVSKEEVNKNDVDMRKALTSMEPGKQGLNLMTCAGKYDVGQQTFNNRLIVYTVRV